MAFQREGVRAWFLRGCAFAIAGLTLLAPAARAQGPQIDTGSPPGAASGASAVGQPLGTANFPDPDLGPGGGTSLGQSLGSANFPDPEAGPSSNSPISGRTGFSASHVFSNSVSTPRVATLRSSSFPQAPSPVAQPLPVPTYGDLELPAGELEYGRRDGMTLDAAIERLINQNLDIEAARLEIPMAQADILTASLRANPVFYADEQLIPYGHFSFLRPGGPQQNDINITYPLDITHKRHARIETAAVARKVTEAQLQDAIRVQIDSLYTVYTGVIAAGLTEDFSKRYLVGITRLYSLNKELYDRGQLKLADLLAIKANLEKAQLQVREARAAKVKANQALALILNMPLTEAEKLDVRDPIGSIQELPMSRDLLIQKGLQNRPDLRAYQIGIIRAEKDVKLAKANAYPDVWLLAQPYTFQNNTYLGVPSAYSWALGVTATIPMYNRNQGNIHRAKINVTQTQIQAKSQERGVVNDVLNAIIEYEQSRLTVIEMRRRSSRRRERFATRLIAAGKEAKRAHRYLDAQQDYNDVVRQYRDALVRFRNAMLDLNTAVAERVVP